MRVLIRLGSDMPQPEDFIEALRRTILRLERLHIAFGVDPEHANSALRAEVLTDAELLAMLCQGLLNGLTAEQPDTLQ